MDFTSTRLITIILITVALSIFILLLRLIEASQKTFIQLLKFRSKSPFLSLELYSLILSAIAMIISTIIINLT
jgi:hypothetical protein